MRQSIKRAGSASHFDLELHRPPSLARFEAAYGTVHAKCERLFLLAHNTQYNENLKIRFTQQSDWSLIAAISEKITRRSPNANQFFIAFLISIQLNVWIPALASCWNTVSSANIPTLYDRDLRVFWVQLWNFGLPPSMPANQSSNFIQLDLKFISEMCLEWKSGLWQSIWFSLEQKEMPRQIKLNAKYW